MNANDLATMSAADLQALIAAANERLEVIKQEHIAAAEALGLKVVDGAPKRKRRAKHESQ